MAFPTPPISKSSAAAASQLSEQNPTAQVDPFKIMLAHGLFSFGVSIPTLAKWEIDPNSDAVFQTLFGKVQEQFQMCIGFDPAQQQQDLRDAFHTHYEKTPAPTPLPPIANELQEADSGVKSRILALDLPSDIATQALNNPQRISVHRVIWSQLANKASDLASKQVLNAEEDQARENKIIRDLYIEYYTPKPEANDKSRLQHYSLPPEVSEAAQNDPDFDNVYLNCLCSLLADPKFDVESKELGNSRKSPHEIPAAKIEFERLLIEHYTSKQHPGSILLTHPQSVDQVLECLKALDLPPTIYEEAQKDPNLLPWYMGFYQKAISTLFKTPSNQQETQEEVISRIKTPLREYLIEHYAPKATPVKSDDDDIDAFLDAAYDEYEEQQTHAVAKRDPILEKLHEQAKSDPELEKKRAEAFMQQQVQVNLGNMMNLQSDEELLSGYNQIPHLHISQDMLENFLTALELPKAIEKAAIEDPEFHKFHLVLCGKKLLQAMTAQNISWDGEEFADWQENFFREEITKRYQQK